MRYTGLSQTEKLIRRLLSNPKDFSYQEVKTLLSNFGYKERTSGKTSGSKVAFTNIDNDYIRMHRPHHRNALLPYQVTNLINDLSERGLL